MYLAIGLLSASGLAFQITLTRIFAIAQGYHFGFLAISIALLGLGASGTALALFPRLSQRDLSTRLARLALTDSLCLVASYLAVNHLPFDAYRIAWERVQLVYLVLFYLALAAPFFLGGLVIAIALAAFPRVAARLYAANLAGAGAGCLAALAALNTLGAEGAVIFSAMLAALGALMFSSQARARAGVCLLAGFLLIAWMVLPQAFTLRLSPYKSLSQIVQFPDARVVHRAENAFSRVQVVESSTIRSAPGLSLNYRGAMPLQRGLFRDAESISPLTDAAPRALLDALPVTLAYRLRPDARALIIKPAGGLEILAALNTEARAIVAVEENPLVTRVEQEFAPGAFADPRVQLATEGARSYVARSRDRFDIVHLALSDPFHPVTAGALALGENYLYTREAFRDYLDRLTDDGILVVHRWLQLPPTEEVRVAAIAIASLDRRPPTTDRVPLAGDGLPSTVGGRILALRSFNTFLLLVKPTPFTAREIERARAFAEERQFDWVYRPGLDAAEANRFNVLREDEYYRAFQELIDASQRTRFFAEYAYDVSPTSDDRPFFSHFFKWEQMPLVLELLGKTFQPFGGSGYLILLVLLAVSIVASVVLILLPLGVQKTESREPKERREKPFAPFAPVAFFRVLSRLSRLSHSFAPLAYFAFFRALSRLSRLSRSFAPLAYFAFLGLGYLFVEIPLIQRFILLLDHPVYAFAIVIFTLLIASGAGSFFSPRLSHRAALVLLILTIATYQLLLPAIVDAYLGVPFLARALISVAFLAPLGFLMGIPFPKGLARLDETMSDLIPLAWGVNGCASVIASILATMGALSFGFAVVMFAGAVCYVGALFTTSR